MCIAKFDTIWIARSCNNQSTLHNIVLLGHQYKLYLCYGQTEQPLPLVVEHSLCMAVFQILDHPSNLVSNLSSLAKVCTASETSHDHLKRVEFVIQLELVIKQFLVKLFLVCGHL